MHSPQLVIVLELADAGDLSRMIKVWLTHTQYCAKVMQTEVAEFHFLFFWNFIELSCKSWYKDVHLQLASFCNNKEQYFFKFLSLKLKFAMENIFMLAFVHLGKCKTILCMVQLSHIHVHVLVFILLILITGLHVSQSSL